MRKTASVSHLIRKAFLLVAMLAACVFSAGNGLQPLLSSGQYASIEVQQEEGGAEDERPAAYVGYASSALLPVASVSFLYQPDFRILFPPVPVREVKPRLLPPLRVDNYFRTLFCLIISPNAP